MSKFYKLSPSSRLKELTNSGKITAEESKLISNSVSKEQLTVCNNLSENVIGGYVLPLSVIPNVIINNKSYTIPMVTEETSVVAAINKAAKIIKSNGSITTKTSRNVGIGQIYIPETSADFLEKVNNYQSSWQSFSNKNMLNSMCQRGGGMLTIKARNLGKNSGVIHFNIDTCDAMGANIINQTLEQLAPIISKDLKTKVGIKVLSNLTDTAITEANIRVKLDQNIAQAIYQAATFSEQDTYRACTHNKGIMNGIDALLIATGNDWRAVEAAMHTYSNQKPISSWQLTEGNILIGQIRAPINVGICGGVTAAQPLAKACLNILGVKSAGELAGIVAAIGLIQNLAALTALATKGICQGHMKLHITNIIAQMSLSSAEKTAVKSQLTMAVKAGAPVTISSAQKILAQMRANK